LIHSPTCGVEEGEGKNGKGMGGGQLPPNISACTTMRTPVA
jgi:hypothetical protein